MGNNSVVNATTVFPLVFLFLPFLSAQNGVNDKQGQELIFPIVHSAFLDGSINLQTTFSFMNLANSTAQATIVTYQDNGIPKRVFGLCSPSGPPPDSEEIELEFEIPSGGGRDFLTQADNEAGLPDFSGWAR